MKCALILGITGLIIGLALGTANHLLREADSEIIVQIMDKLPGYNCGACGYAGCRGLAEAIAAGEAGINRCKALKKKN